MVMRREKSYPIKSNIIGTMNTSDQNVFTLDPRFWRRWEMRMIENNFDKADRNFKSSILDLHVMENFCTNCQNIQ